MAETSALVPTDTLKPRQRKFVQHYLKTLNATESYKNAGYSAQGNVAEAAASRLLRNVKVEAAIAKVLGKQVRKLEVSAEKVLQEAARIAFLDIRCIYEDDGTLKPVSQWPDEVAAAVAGIESVQQYTYHDGQKIPVGVLKKIKLWDKPSQLALLAKHLKLLHDETPNTIVNVQVNVSTSLAEALHHAYRDATP